MTEGSDDSPDLVTFGESMLRLGTPAGERFVTADALDLHIGGAESNVAATAARLGTDAVWLSKLPDSPLADRVVEGIERHGVDVRVARDEGRVGTYYLDSGGEPRGTEVVYDREGAAVRTATPEELDLDAVEAAERFLVTGITPALSDTLTATTRELLETAREAGTETVFDPNYRAKLWTPEEARETLTDLLPLVDTLVVAERDAREVLAREGTPEEIAAGLAEEFGHETVVLTRGDAGALAWTDDDTVEQDVFEADTYDAVGSGDAFVGGFLVAKGDGKPLSEALAWGAASASLKRTIAGDVAVISRDDVERVLSDASGIDR